jgi:integrase
MATIQFLIQSKNNPAAIYVRLREGRMIDVKAKTNYVIDPACWNKDKKYLKHTKDENLKFLDGQLQQLKSEITKAYNSSVKSKAINTDWLKSIIEPSKQTTIPSNLVEYFEYYREKQRHHLADSSYKKLSVVKNFIIGMEKALRKRFTISDINEDFMNEYLSVGLSLNYSQNYLARNFKFIKTVCYDAENRGVKIDPVLRRLKIKEATTSIIFLTPSEIKAIENVDLKRQALVNARAWLIISCETAQRVSDLLGYRKENISYKNNSKGERRAFLDITQKKTGTIMSIPLSSKVMSIIESNGGEFPRRISDQRYNEYIKDIAKEAGLTNLVDGAKQDTKNKRKIFGKFPKWELVTSHIGRRSYATNNFGIIPTRLLMTMTGHKSENQFLKYIGKSETSMAMQLAEYVK